MNGSKRKRKKERKKERKKLRIICNMFGVLDGQTWKVRTVDGLTDQYQLRQSMIKMQNLP
jgi:hypothetical protein